MIQNLKCYCDQKSLLLFLCILNFQTFKLMLCMYNKLRLHAAIGHVRYINILTWLRGFQVKTLYLVVFSLYLSLFWELRDKGNLKICNFDPKASEPCSNMDISNVACCKLANLWHHLILDLTLWSQISQFWMSTMVDCEIQNLHSKKTDFG